jgi:hypothetical protein
MGTLNVNGRDQSVDGDPATPILWALRDTLGLTGTKFGCGAALCGACTVHLDGQAIRSCVTPISAAEGKKIATIESVTAGSDRQFPARACLSGNGHCTASGVPHRPGPARRKSVPGPGRLLARSAGARFRGLSKPAQSKLAGQSVPEIFGGTTCRVSGLEVQSLMSSLAGCRDPRSRRSPPTASDGNRCEAASSTATLLKGGAIVRMRPPCTHSARRPFELASAVQQLAGSGRARRTSVRINRLGALAARSSAQRSLVLEDKRAGLPRTVRS